VYLGDTSHRTSGQILHGLERHVTTKRMPKVGLRIALRVDLGAVKTQESELLMLVVGNWQANGTKKIGNESAKRWQYEVRR
jgi:hypothetical protein